MATTEVFSIDPADTLNAIVARYPAALAVFQRFGLDTCCGGSLPLATAAEHHALDLEAVLAALASACTAQDSAQ
jgi:iron-sulfur cluster repair protein YtfE (RIC family)